MQNLCRSSHCQSGDWAGRKGRRDMTGQGRPPFHARSLGTYRGKQDSDCRQTECLQHCYGLERPSRSGRTMPNFWIFRNNVVLWIPSALAVLARFQSFF